LHLLPRRKSRSAECVNCIGHFQQPIWDRIDVTAAAKQPGHDKATLISVCGDNLRRDPRSSWNLLAILRLSCCPVKQNINSGSRVARGLALAIDAPQQCGAAVGGRGSDAKKCLPLRFRASPFRSWASFPLAKRLGHARANSAKPAASERNRATSGGHIRDSI